MSNTIFITTPSLNGFETIDRTILSVVTQAGDFYIRYHVQDGGSTDGTRDRLIWWQRRLTSGAFPLQCLGVDFTFASEPDKGMYDALCRGFGAMRIPVNSFMTWINADDILMPGALAFVVGVERQFTPEQVSWLGGSTSLLYDNTPTVSFDNPIPRSALKAGLCDGVHWNFLQQEGTFFRSWLWTAIKPDKTIRPMKLAGDWNLWRLFAEQAQLIQAKFALGSFRIQDGQLSARLREKYMAEIDSIVPAGTRRERLKMLGAKAPVLRRVIRVSGTDGRMSVFEEDKGGLLSHNHLKVFNEKFARTDPAESNRLTAEGDLGAQSAMPPAETISFNDNILAYDADWQFPAITEQHAYHQLRDLGGIPDGVIYVAYPWANLIDKLQTKAPDAHIYLARFRHFCRQSPAGSDRVTVCQHIKMKEFLHLFEEAGISNIFWTHATHQDLQQPQAGGVSLHPFPLYPVQVTRETDPDATAARPYLFSFIGAKSNKYYLTDARAQILDLLQDHPKGLIIGRDSWHYNKVVYEHQIRTPNGKQGELVNQSASEQFKASLAQSLFSLCPSGSGPNSIRLWESLGAGSIPVILADTYAPPGNPDLWRQAAVFCPETADAIRALPARLEEISKDPERIARMRHAMRQLWLLYGPHSFVYDLQALMLKLARTADETAAQDGGEPATRQLALRLAANKTMSARDAEQVLRVCSGDLLLHGIERLGDLEGGSTLGQVLALAQHTLPANHPLAQHFRQVLDHVQRYPRSRGGAASINRGTAPKICLAGGHSHRTPLSYAPFRKAAGDRIELVDDPMRADVVMTGFNLDFRENADLFAPLTGVSAGPKLVVLSEEPLWDSIWSGGFTDRKRHAKCGEGELSYTFLNHSNSTIFDFEAIPYFLLTSVDYLARYGLLIARHTDLTPAQLLRHWQGAPIPAAFYAEQREDARYGKDFPDQAVYGLSTYRTEIARKVTLPGTVREGRGWRADAKRQALPDWHLDKIAALDMRVRVASSFENTHQHSYISEKIFDAFVVGGIPTYYADKDHRVLNLVPETSMINTWGLTPGDAAARIMSFRPDEDFAAAWLRTAGKLQQTFTDVVLVARERQRVVNAILDEIEAL